MTAAEWQNQALDLDAYLERIERPVTAGVAPDAGTLALLHRAHVAHVPFENVDVVLGRTVSVDLAEVQAKLVGARRGGYCYEHGLLFAAVLERFGFRVVRLLARVGDGSGVPHARTHMALDVTDDAGGRWLADVGFGSGLLRPIPLQDGVIVRQGVWTYRLLHDDVTGWALQLDEDGWTTQYTVDTQGQHLADIAMSNHYTQTWPTSPFRQRLVVVCKDEDAVHRLLDRQLSTTRPGHPDQVRTVRDEELPAVLARLGLHLPDDLLDTLRSRPTLTVESER